MAFRWHTLASLLGIALWACGGGGEGIEDSSGDGQVISGGATALNGAAPFQSTADDSAQIGTGQPGAGKAEAIELVGSGVTEPSTTVPELSVAAPTPSSPGYPPELESSAHPDLAGCNTEPVDPVPLEISIFEQAAREGCARAAACRVPGLDGEMVSSDCYTRIETLVEGQRVFHADSREAGAKCGKWLPLGTQVHVTVEVGDGCQLAYWTSGFNVSEGAYCPCEGSTASHCEFSLEHDTYCGAVFDDSPVNIDSTSE